MINMNRRKIMVNYLPFHFFSYYYCFGFWHFYRFSWFCLFQFIISEASISYWFSLSSCYFSFIKAITITLQITLKYPQNQIKELINLIHQFINHHSIMIHLTIILLNHLLIGYLILSTTHPLISLILPLHLPNQSRPCLNRRFLLN